MKKPTKLITLEELDADLFPTPEEKAEFEKEFAAFEIENDKAVLRELGHKLKKARVKAGITQSELAAKIKTNKTNISRVEHGRQNMTVEYLQKVGNALNRPVRIEIL